MRDLILRRGEFGSAVIANRNFLKGEDIFEFTGAIMKRADLPALIRPEDDRYIQIGIDKYLGPSGDFDDFFNHSCTPNSGIVIEKRVMLVAIMNIRKGEEIVLDYSTTMDEDDWEIECKCRSKNCRKRIRDFKHLPRDTQCSYIALGIVPIFIQEQLR